MPLSDEQQAIITKLEDGLNRPFEQAASGAVGPVPLSINERTLVAESLRFAWLTRKEWKSYRRQRELEDYGATKRLARYVMPYGQREEWVQRLYGKSKEALKRYFIRRRAP
jgi:hypothetical protein